MCEVFQEGQLETLYENRYGPLEESSWNFVNRMYSRLCSFLCQPPRFEYSLSDLATDHEKIVHNIAVCPFTVKSDGIDIFCVQWEVVRDPELCIIYIHSNTRSLVDSIEILPFAKQLGANLIGFDLPGCGKSEGVLSAQVALHVKNVIEVSQRETKCKRIIIWGRGTGTYPAMDYCASVHVEEHAQALGLSVQLLVLDTPFTSFRDVVNDAIARYESEGNYFPRTMFAIVSKLIRMTIKRRAGIDLYHIRPIDLCAKLTMPSLILAATADDYVAPSHGLKIQAACKGPSTYHTIHGGQFTHRTPEQLMPFAYQLLA